MKKVTQGQLSSPWFKLSIMPNMVLTSCLAPEYALSSPIIIEFEWDSASVSPVITICYQSLEVQGNNTKIKITYWLLIIALEFNLKENLT